MTEGGGGNTGTKSAVASEACSRWKQPCPQRAAAEVTQVMELRKRSVLTSHAGLAGDMAPPLHVHLELGSLEFGKSKAGQCRGQKRRGALLPAVRGRGALPAPLPMQQLSPGHEAC